MTLRYDRLDPLDALAQAGLRGAQEGRLSYSSGCGPRSVVVRYALSGSRPVFRLPEYSSALPYARNQFVTLQVAACETSGHTGEAVLVISGRARLVEEMRGVDGPSGWDEQWPQGVATHLVEIAPSRVELVRPS